MSGSLAIAAASRSAATTSWSSRGRSERSRTRTPSIERRRSSVSGERSRRKREAKAPSSARGLATGGRVSIADGDGVTRPASVSRWRAADTASDLRSAVTITLRKSSDSSSGMCATLVATRSVFSRRRRMSSGRSSERTTSATSCTRSERIVSSVTPRRSGSARRSRARREMQRSTCHGSLRDLPSISSAKRIETPGRPRERKSSRSASADTSGPESISVASARSASQTPSRSVKDTTCRRAKTSARRGPYPSATPPGTTRRRSRTSPAPVCTTSSASRASRCAIVISPRPARGARVACERRRSDRANSGCARSAPGLGGACGPDEAACSRS